MKVAYLTIVYGSHVTEKVAHHLTAEIAGMAVDFPAVAAAKCDVGELDDPGEALWREAHEE